MLMFRNMCGHATHQQDTFVNGADGANGRSGEQVIVQLDLVKVLFV